jgi:hypothetical protein
LETVEQWIEAPAQGIDAPEQDRTELIEQVYSPIADPAPAAEEYASAVEYAPVPQYVSNAEYMPTEYVVSESVVTEISAPKVIAPVRSPGIVLPEPAQPEPGSVAEEDEYDEDEELEEEESTPWTKHLLPWALLVLAVLICLIALAQLVPGWWSQFIAGLVDGYSGRGAGWGAGIGFLFTYIATLMIGHAVHKWANWKAPVALVIGGLIVAAPNLFTLWINHGPTTAARTANALLDRTAPLFRGASLAGAAAGLALGILTTVLYRLWRKRTRRIKAMESLVDDYA